MDMLGALLALFLFAVVAGAAGGAVAALRIITWADRRMNEYLRSHDGQF
jgi:hypothetical protein